MDSQKKREKMSQLIKYAIVGAATVAIMLLIMKGCGDKRDYASEITALRDSARSLRISDSIKFTQQIKEKQAQYDSSKLATNKSLHDIDSITRRLDKANEKAAAAINDYNQLLAGNPDSAKIAAACNPVKVQLEEQLTINQNLTTSIGELNVQIVNERAASDSVSKKKDEFLFQQRQVIKMQDQIITTAAVDLKKVQKKGNFWQGAAKVVAAVVVAETTYILLKK